MQETYITLEEAARFEGVEYEAIKKRVQRNPTRYKTRTEAREGGGKELVLLSTASLSQKGRRAYRAQIRAMAEPEEAGKTAPWYVEADLNSYIEQHKRAYYEAVELARRVQDFLDNTGPDRTGYAERLAVGLGVSPQTLYRYTQSVQEAGVWARRLEAEDGHGRDYFRALALCRKPREKATFPSLTEEQKAIIQNIWFDRDFADNGCTVEMLYEALQQQGAARGWESVPSCKTVGRYVRHLMELPAAESARYLAANGLREWKNKKEVKGKRDSSTLEVMEYLVADAHTFDVWVSYTTPNGKQKAIRPVLVAWEDMKTRRLLGPILCEHSNTQIVKESFIKACYDGGAVPKHVHTDNGKDFANLETLGQDRSIRAMDRAAMDAEMKGFYLAMGAKDWSRSLPFQPWDKLIERAFGTFCKRYSRKFKAYTGTLTGSRTDAKRKKDIDGMLERGELLTLEEFYDLLVEFLETWYDRHEHQGLKAAGERWTKPAELWEHAPHYEKAVPPREYALMLLMKPGRAKVRSQGIQRNNLLYTADELCHYVDKWVNIRWDPEDVTRLYVYDKEGRRICEARTAELLEFGDRVSEEALEALHKRKKRQLRGTREFLEEMQTPPEARGLCGPQATAGKLDLTIGHTARPKVVSLPVDKEFRGTMTPKKQKAGGSGGAFLDAKAGAALKRLKAMNE